MTWKIVGQPYRGANPNVLTVSEGPSDPGLVRVVVQAGSSARGVVLSPEQAVLAARQLLDASILAQNELDRAAEAQEGGPR